MKSNISKITKLQILKEKLNKNGINYKKDKGLKTTANSVSWSWRD